MSVACRIASSIDSLPRKGRWKKKVQERNSNKKKESIQKRYTRSRQHWSWQCVCVCVCCSLCCLWGKTVKFVFDCCLDTRLCIISSTMLPINSSALLLPVHWISQLNRCAPRQWRQLDLSLTVSMRSTCYTCSHTPTRVRRKPNVSGSKCRVCENSVMPSY